MRASLVVLLLPLPLLLGAAWPAAHVSRPTLKASGVDPLTVRGSGFRARESVRVTLKLGSVNRAARTVSSARGGFTIRFNLATPYDPCTTGLILSARGSEGDGASLKLVPRECPPAP